MRDHEPRRITVADLPAVGAPNERYLLDLTRALIEVYSNTLSPNRQKVVSEAPSLVSSLNTSPINPAAGPS